jgi:hypothetical protein
MGFVVFGSATSAYAGQIQKGEVKCTKPITVQHTVSFIGGGTQDGDRPTQGEANDNNS